MAVVKTLAKPNLDHEIERFRVAAELSSLGVWDWDLVSGDVYWSPELLRHAGLKEDEFGGRAEQFFKALHPDDVDYVQRALQAHFDSNEPYEVTLRTRVGDGYRSWRTAGRALRNELGEPIRMIGVMLDVEEQVAAETALEASEQRFRDMATNVPGALYQYVLYPDAREAVTYMSPACELLWGHKAEEFEREATILWQTVHESDLIGLRKSMFESARSLRPWAHQWRIMTPAGKEKWVQGRGVPRKLEDGAVVWNSLVLDISEQVRTERELYESREILHHAQKMEALGQLTGGLAHDFNNLLLVISSGLEVLKAEGNLSDLQRQTVSEALDATGRGAELTRTLLSFAKRAELAPESIELDGILRDIAGLARHTLPANIEVEISPGGDGTWVELDRAPFENAVLNLILNARDALPRGGTVTVSTGVRKAYVHSELGEGDFAWVCVADDGAGMCEETKVRAFEPFFTTKGPGRGTGLGLSMVHGFVSQSGGSVELRSEVDQGTQITLWFRLAAAKRPFRAHQGGEMDDTPQLDIRMLFVEDDERVRRSLVRVLTRHGIDVVAAADGASAMELFVTDGPFDVVLSDVQMPGEIQGDELARRIESSSDVPVILLSGNPPEHRCTEHVTYLLKPMRGPDLVAAIAARVGASL